LVELWRGREELYVFSPDDKSCQLIDWVSHGIRCSSIAQAFLITSALWS
jgi:hypothetical protein